MFLLTDCHPAQPPAVAPIACAPPATLQVRDQLFLGRNIPDGGEVSDSVWKAFLAREVTPRFPEGITVIRAEGEWRAQAGTLVEERTWILVLYHPATGAADRDVAAIADAYRQAFHQEAVLRDRSQNCLSF